MNYKLYKDDYDNNYELMRIEEASLDDAENILSLQKIAYRREAEIVIDFNIEPLMQTVDEISEDMTKKYVLKACIVLCDSENKNGSKPKIIGSVRASQFSDTCYVGKLIVDPDYQNMGIGSELMNQIEKRFASAERFELFTGEKSLRNIHFYQRIGYNIFKSVKQSEALTLFYFEKKSQMQV